MKITVNFSTGAGGMIPYLTLTCLILAIAAGIATVALFLSAREIRGDVVELQRQLARFGKHDVVVPENLLPHERLVALREQVKVLNGLTGQTGRTLPLLLATLEKVMPDGVWITNLQYRPRELETKLLVEADRTGLLTDFMDRLEHSGHFARVLLTRQTQRSEGAQRTIQFEIQLQERQ
jgi:Tfp pilus assembly protein PilN